MAENIFRLLLTHYKFVLTARRQANIMRARAGEVAERLNALVLKTSKG